MATLGIDNAKLALVDSKGNVLTGTQGIFKYTANAATDTTGIFTADADTSMGIASVALTNLEGSTTDISGSNRLVYKSAGKGAAQAVLTINALPNEIKMAVLGRKSDGKGGYVIDGKVNSNNRVALLAKSAESFDISKPVYVALYMSNTSEASVTLTSNSATEARSTDAITFAALERGDDGFGKYFFSSSPQFSEQSMMADVFKTSTTQPSGGSTSGQ